MTTSGEAQPFNPRTLLALIGLAAVTFFAMAYFMIAGEDGRSRPQASATTNSRSAVGYRAFIELLRHMELPVGTPSQAELAQSSLRIVLAPRSAQEVQSILSRTSRPVLIVLPKWQAFARPYSDHVASAHLLATEVPQSIARAVADDVQIVRPGSPGPWRTRLAPAEPSLAHPQLMHSDKICPDISAGEDTLLGHLCRRPAVSVLADPDLLANHGLWRGDNAVLVMAAIARARYGNGPIVALELASLAPPSRSIWRLAISPPFVLITFTALVAAAIAVWAAAIRFGPPQAEEPPRPGGLMTLIDTTARLLRERVDGGRLLRRYADLLVVDVGSRLHAPRGLQGPAEIGAWLDSARKRDGRTSGAAPTYGELSRSIEAAAKGDKASAAAIVAAAAQVHLWREDLLNGR
jgi:hypothetical protein